MTITSQFPELLRVAERDGEGGLSAEPRHIKKGQTISFTFNLPEHSVFGDWTDGAFDGPLRAAPGASGDPLAEYTFDVGTPAGQLTPITMTLRGDEQDGLPDVNPSTALAEVFLAIGYTPPEGSRETLLTTRQLVGGAI